MQKYKHIPLETLVNARDLGGYPADGGTVTKYGVFIRSEIPKQLSDADKKFLHDYGVKATLDLRGKKETENLPSCLRDEPGMFYKHLPLMDPDAAKASDDNNSEKAPENFWDIEWTPVYISILEDGKAWVRDVIEFCTEQEGTILYHCFTGKDRTGIISALILGLCGVSVYDIMCDYSLSMVLLRPFYDALPGGPYLVDAEGRPDYNRGFYRTAPETMERVFEHFEKNYGGVREYALSCGISPETIEKLRQKLLEPAE